MIMSDVLFERLFEDVYWPEDDFVQPADPSCEQHHTEPDSTTPCLLPKADDVSANQASDKSEPCSTTPAEVSAFTTCTDEVHQTDLCGIMQPITNPTPPTRSQTMEIAQLVDVDVLLAQIQEPIPKSQLPQMELYPTTSVHPLLDANVADQAGPSANQLACQRYRERRRSEQVYLIKELGILKEKNTKLRMQAALKERQISHMKDLLKIGKDSRGNVLNYAYKEFTMESGDRAAQQTYDKIACHELVATDGVDFGQTGTI